MRSEHGGLQLLGRRNVRDGAALLHHHTNTDARERYAAHWHKVAGFVVIVHRRHREDDGVERLLRELLVDVKRWSDSKGHLMAFLPLEFSSDGLRRDLGRSDAEYTHLGSGGEGRCDDECKRTDGYSAKRWAHEVLKERCCGHCARIYTRGRLSPIRFTGRVGRGIPALFSSQGECVVGHARNLVGAGEYASLLKP